MRRMVPAMNAPLDPQAVAMGQAVRGAIAQADLTLAETAPQTTMHLNTLSRRVNGISAFTWPEIVQIADVTGVTPSELVASACRIAERREPAKVGV